MQIAAADLKPLNGDILQLALYVIFPSLGWSDVTLTEVVHVAAPWDGVQDFKLSASPPPGPVVLPTIMSWGVSARFSPAEWFRGVRIRDKDDRSLLTLLAPVRGAHTIGDTFVAVEGMGVRDDKLVVDVSRSGDCGQHRFELCWDGALLESLPPKAVLTLRHESDDPCRALRHEALQFDLSLLGLEPGPIVLILKTAVTETQVIATLREPMMWPFSSPPVGADGA